MKTATNVMFVLVMGLMMVTASALFTAGYPSVLAKKSSDSGSGGGSGSGSSSGGNVDGGNGNGNSNPGPSPTKDDQNGKTTIDNPPATTEPITSPPTSETGGDAGACVVGAGSPCSSQPAGHPNKPSLLRPDKDCAFDPDVLAKCKPDNNGQCPPGFSHNAHDNCFPNGKCPPGFSRQDEDESGKCFPDKQRPPNQIIVIHKTIHSSSSSGSHSLSNGCFDAIKIAWLGKVHRGQNQEVDSFIDKCLGVH
jgi:hypothetical protein